MSNIASFLLDSVKKNPENICISMNDTHWSYEQVFQEVSVVYAMLKKNGVCANDNIVLYIDNSLEYVIAYFAILFLGATIVPVSKTRNTLIPYIIEDSQANIIVTHKNLRRKLKQTLPHSSIKILVLDNRETTEHTGVIDLQDWVCDDVDSMAMILYTSGTTRDPLGVALTHKNLEANTCSILEYLQLTEQDSILVTIPLAYSYGNSLLLTHLKVGGTIHIDNRASYPRTILEQIRASRVTGYSTVGSYLNILLKQDEECYRPAFNSLRYITFAGESVYTNDIKKLREIAPNLRIFGMYGQTEASARLSYLDPDLLLTKMGSIGKGIPGVTLRVVNADGKDVIPGEVGEIIAHGENIMPGYWKKPESTQEVIREGWLYTGDMATVDDDGFIYIKGRKKDIIKYLGHRLSPVEIETAINTHTDVLESAVIEDSSDNGARIKAYVVLKDDATTDQESILTHLKRILPTYMIPHEVEFIAELPKTYNSKIQRSKLRKPL